MAELKFKVGGDIEDVAKALDDMEGDSMCDGTWAADTRHA